MPYVSCSKLDAEVAALQTQIDSLSGGTTVVDATESVKGIVELATTAEAAAGTSTSTVVTPAGVKAALDAAAPNLVDSQGNALAADACVLKCPTTAGTAGQVLTAQADGSTVWAAASSGGLTSIDPSLTGNGSTTPLAVVSATDAQRGAVETATAAEIAAGTATGSSGPLVMTPDDTIAALNDTATAGGTPLQKAVVNAFEQAISSDPGALSAIATALPLATESVNGVIQLATTAEAQAWVDDSTAITPLKLAQAFINANQDLTLGFGYQKLPGGLILQWGAAAGPTGAANTFPANVSTTFPIAFPNKAITLFQSCTSPIQVVGLNNLTATGAEFNFFNIGIVGSSPSIRYFAIGH